MKKFVPTLMAILLAVCITQAQGQKTNKEIIDNQTTEQVAPMAAGDDGQIPLQGRLTDGGTPVNAVLPFTFSISYDTVSWTETHPSVNVTNGFYAVALGSINPLPENIFEGVNSRTLNITVDTVSLSPIQIYGPYGAKKGTIDEPDTTRRDFIRDLKPNDSTYLAGYEGQVVTNETDSFPGLRTNWDAGVRGLVSTNGFGAGVFGHAEQRTGQTGFVSGVYGTSSGGEDVVSYGVRGEVNTTASTFAAAVRGLMSNTAPNAQNFGGDFSVNTADSSGTATNYGVRGRALAPGVVNYGVYGWAANGTTNYAGFFRGNVQVEDGEINVASSAGPAPTSRVAQGSLTAGGEDGEVNGWLGFNWYNGGAQSNNRGSVILWGDTTTRSLTGGVDIMRAALTVADDGFGNDVGNLQLKSPTFGDNTLVDLGINSDSANFQGRLILKGSDGSFFEINSNGIASPTQADKYLLTDSVSSWMTFDAGNGLSSQINFTGAAGAPGGASLGNKGWQANPNNGYLHVNDTTPGHAVRLEAESDGGTGDNYGVMEMRNSNGGRIFANSRDMEWYSPNDSISATIGSRNGDYAGAMYLYDSLGEIKAQMVGRNNGGYIQLDNRDGGGSLLSAIAMAASSANGGTSYFNMYGADQTGSAFFGTPLIDLYLSDKEIGIGNTTVLDNGLIRSGTDWRANDGNTYAAVGSAGSETGDPNPNGMSGFLSMWGDGSFNAQLTGKRWENNNLPLFTMSGYGGDNFVVEVMQGPGTENYADLKLNGTDSTTGYFNESVLLTSDLNGTNAGGIELRDSSNFTSIILDGNSGDITANNFFANGNIFAPGGFDTDGQINSSGLNIFGAFSRMNIWNSTDTTYQVVEAFEESDYGIIDLRDEVGSVSISLQGSTGANSFFAGGVDFDQINSNFISNNSSIFAGDGFDDAVQINDGSPGVQIFSGGTGGASDDGVQTVNLDGSIASTGLTLNNSSSLPTATMSVSNNASAAGDFGIIELSNDTTFTFGYAIQLDGESGVIRRLGGSFQVSDRRFKKDIVTQKYALDKIKRLRGVEYAWKNPDKPQKNIGFIAQEVEEVYPELVETSEDGYKMVDYASLVSALVEAIKELDEKVTDLANENQELKAELAKSSGSEIDKLKAEIAEIKALISQSQTVGK